MGRVVRHGGIIAAAWLAAAPAAALTLPPPSGNPATIDFAADPVLRFARIALPAAALLDRLARAVAGHPAVAAAAAQVTASQGIRIQIRAALFPQADLSLVAGRQLARDFGSRQTIVESLQPRGRTDGVASVDQLLFDWGATARRIAAADARIGAARADVEAAASDAALAAAAAWSDVIAADELAGLAAAASERQRIILGEVQLRAALGVGAASDIARVEAMGAETAAATARAERQRGEARARFRETFGSDAPPAPARAAVPPSAAQSLDAVEALARRVPAVIASLHRADAAGRDLAAARADGRPRLSAGVVGTRYDVFGGSDYELRGQLTLRQSLSAGGRQRGLVEEAAGKARAAGFDADRTAALSVRDAAAAFAAAHAAAATLVAAEAGYIAERRVRDAYAEQFRVARGSLVELLRAEVEYQAAAGTLIQAACDEDVARFALLARTGELLPLLGIHVTEGDDR